MPFIDLSYIFKPLSDLKRNLVGDLGWNDVKSLLRFQLPNETIGIISGGTVNDDEVYIKQFGLLGQVFSLNVAYVHPKMDSTIQMKDLLEALDELPEARKPYQQFSDLTGTPHLIATSGVEGLALRKKLVAILPQPAKVGEVAVQITQAMIAGIYPAKSIALDDDQLYQTVVRQVLLRVLLDCELTPEIDQLLSKMNSVLLDYSNEEGVEHDFKMWVQSLLTAEKTLGSSALSAALKNRLGEAGGIGSEDKEKWLLGLACDPTINALFTTLVTSENIKNLVYVALSKNSVMQLPWMKKLLLEMKDKGLVYDKEGLMDYKIISELQSLDCIFKEALSKGSFSPDVLARYVSKPMTIQGKDIPAGTLLFFHPRKDPNKSFNPDRFELASAPTLGSESFMPFSIGRRQCPGSRIAEAIFKATVAVISGSIDAKVLVVNEESSKKCTIQ